MSYHRRRFNDDWDQDPWEFDLADDQPTAAPRNDDLVDTITGQDNEAVVTVHVTAEAELVAVKLDSNWKRTVEPHNLHMKVVTAANAATTQAMAQSARQAETTVSREAQIAADDETPITREDTLRMASAVTADLEQYLSKVTAVVNSPASAESSGGHVTGTGQRGQILEIEIDSHWATSSRNSEIESELTECLKTIKSKSSIGDLASGPQSKNIAEMQAILGDPQKLLRRLGLTRPSSNQQTEQ